jgi:hypothetical protein
VGALALWSLGAAPSVADDVRPVKILVKELPLGAFDVQWEVPKVVRPQLMPSPRLPESCRPEGERTFLDRPSAWLSRQVYECPGGLAGQALGVRFPAYNIALSTLIRVDLASGDRYARLLSPGEDSWRVPEPDAGGVASALAEGREAVLAGAGHFFGGAVHLAFLLVLCLLGAAPAGVRLATAFWLAQTGAVAVGALLGLRLDVPLAEIALALATVLLAREALRPPDDRRQLTLLTAGAGALHGLGVPGLVAVPGPEAEPGVVLPLLVVLGMDAALLLSLGVVSGLGRLVGDRLARVPRAAAYLAGAGAFALALSSLLDGPAVADETEQRLRLPSLGAGTGGTTLPGSRRLASGTPDAPIQSFLAVEAFEVRHEVLVRLRDVARRVGVSAGDELAVEDQDGVKESLRALVLERASLELEGQTPEPLSQRVDFVTLDEKGVLPRPEPVPEAVEDAWVGVTVVYLTETTARELSLTWEPLEEAPEIPATVTDPEVTRSEVLTAKSPALRWTNELTEDPAPTVTAVEVEPASLTVPVGGLAVGAVGLLLAGAALRRRRRPLALVLARVTLAAAVLVGPLGTVAVALPWSETWTPGSREATRILARILPNVYRSLESRSESAVFDRLALSVTGETLTDVYLDHRKVLQMEERGGARARVEAVEVVAVDTVEATESGAFWAEAVWTVGGTVTHFGHRHFRQNRYDARVEVVPDQGVWKLRTVEILDEQRLR